MDDVFGRKAVALRRLGLAGGTAVEGAALGQQLRTGCPVEDVYKRQVYGLLSKVLMAAGKLCELDQATQKIVGLSRRCV